ncbi:hypothetical protein M3Y99_01704900 [Aphelenchoides fujianensis]|nr:hypothetical protein M3Y99_01704900 [Aphelenchoides fujianensis]
MRSVLFLLLFFSVVPTALAASCRDSLSSSECTRLQRRGDCLSDRRTREDNCRQTCGDCDLSTREVEDLDAENERDCRDAANNCDEYERQCTNSRYEVLMKTNLPENVPLVSILAGLPHATRDACEDEREDCAEVRRYCDDREYGAACPAGCSNDAEECEDTSDSCTRHRDDCESRESDVRQLMRKR